VGMGGLVQRELDTYRKPLTEMSHESLCHGVRMVRRFHKVIQ